MGDWLDLHAVCVNEWMSRKCLENGLSYNVYFHYNLTFQIGPSCCNRNSSYRHLLL